MHLDDVTLAGEGVRERAIAHADVHMAEHVAGHVGVTVRVAGHVAVAVRVAVRVAEHVAEHVGVAVPGVADRIASIVDIHHVVGERRSCCTKESGMPAVDMQPDVERN